MRRFGAPPSLVARMQNEYQQAAGYYQEERPINLRANLAALAEEKPAAADSE